ncbi:MAG: hypothetical protein K1X66_02430 [Verrucomicrobiae bacterium]|nr:hypothetical protein [Verrucomicrobiae bacterium]
MNPGLEYYRALGEPATGTIKMLNIKPSLGDTVTIDGTVFTYGTDFNGDSEVQRARQLTVAVNADRNELSIVNALANPIKKFYAIYIGNTVYLIASVPGTDYNGTVISTSNTDSFSVTNFSGGTNKVLQAQIQEPINVIVQEPLQVQFGQPIDVNVLQEPVNNSTTKCLFTSGTKTIAMPGTPEPLSGISFLVQSVEIQAQFFKVANANNVYIGINGDVKRIVEPGDSYTLEAPPGKKIDLNDIYLDVDNGSDGVFYLAIL